jgi:thiol:disulfide interchange protein DsbD
MTWITAAAFAVALPVTALAAPVPGEPLEPEKAFPVAAILASGGIDLVFRIPEGYYLYGDRFRVEPDPGLPVGPARLPQGVEIDDPFIGRTRILRGSAVLHLPFTGGARAGTYRIRVTAQGCAEEKVCYAPFTQDARVRIP